MTTEPILIAGQWQPSTDPLGAFSASNPATRQELPASYPVSGLRDVELAVGAAEDAVQHLRRTPRERVARFLEIYAENIEASADALVECDHIRKLRSSLTIKFQLSIQAEVRVD